MLPHKKIEPHEVQNSPNLTKDIREFWTDNINAERIMGKTISDSDRGSENYFLDLQKQRYRSHRHLLPWIESMEATKDVLEIGSGIGLDTFTMAKHGLNITALDLTTVGISLLKKRFERENMDGDFLVGDGCYLPFDNNQFDYIYSFGVLHHASDTKQAINEIHRVLKSNGQTKIMLYNRHSFNEMIHRFLLVPFEERKTLCPVVRRYTIAEVKDMFKDYSQLEVSLDFIYGEGYGIIFKLTPKWLYKYLSKYFGWHIMINATK